VSRIIKTESAGKDRTQMTKAIMITIRELAAKKDIDDEARDMAAFLALTLYAIYDTIDESVKAWEKRDYWMKADQFRMQWQWTGVQARKVREAALLNDWAELAACMPEIASKLGTIKLPKSNTIGKPWTGALMELKKRDMDNKVKK
jgi:hypothetical protein